MGPRISVPARPRSTATSNPCECCACKSHNGNRRALQLRSCTLCMKTISVPSRAVPQAQHSGDLHVGNSAASPTGDPVGCFLIINKHSAHSGGNPVASSCASSIALLSNGASGPGGGWDKRTDRLVMGHLCSSGLSCVQQDPSRHNHHGQLSMPALGVTNAAIILPNFLTSFGYAETDVPDWIELIRAAALSRPPAAAAVDSGLQAPQWVGPAGLQAPQWWDQRGCCRRPGGALAEPEARATRCQRSWRHAQRACAGTGWSRPVGGTSAVGGSGWHQCGRRRAASAGARRRRKRSDSAFNGE